MHVHIIRMESKGKKENKMSFLCNRDIKLGTQTFTKTIF